MRKFIIWPKKIGIYWFIVIDSSVMLFEINNCLKFNNLLPFFFFKMHQKYTLVFHPLWSNHLDSFWVTPTFHNPFNSLWIKSKPVLYFLSLKDPVLYIRLWSKMGCELHFMSTLKHKYARTSRCPQIPPRVRYSHTHTQTLVLTVTLSLMLCQAQRWTCKWLLRLISVLLQNSCHCRKPLELLDVVYSLPTGRALSMPASSLWADECCMTTITHSQPSYSSRRRSSQRGLYACCASVHVRVLGICCNGCVDWRSCECVCVCVF